MIGDPSALGGRRWWHLHFDLDAKGFRLPVGPEMIKECKKAPLFTLFRLSGLATVAFCHIIGYEFVFMPGEDV